MSRRTGRGSVTRHCWCKNPDTGRPYRKGECPKFGDPKHGAWAFTLDLGKFWDDGAQRYRRQQLHRSGYPRKRDAERALGREITEVDQGAARTLEQRRMTISEWLDRWLAAKVDLRPASYATYRGHIETTIRPALGRIQLADLQPDHIRRMLDRARHRGCGDQTLHHILALTKTILNGALDDRLIVWNPCRPVKVRTPRKRRFTPWSVAEAEAFLAHVREADPRLFAAFLLAVRCGLRRGEVLALRWSDLDLDERTLTVARSTVQAGSETVVGEPKSRSGARTLPLDSDTTEELREHRRRQSRERLAAETWEDSDLVACDEHGRMVAPWRLTARFRELVDGIDLPKIRLHDVRHTAGTVWREAGTDYKIIQEWMGHSTLAMTMDVYGHVRPQVSSDAIERVAAYRRASM